MGVITGTVTPGSAKRLPNPFDLQLSQNSDYHLAISNSYAVFAAVLSQTTRVCYQCFMPSEKWDPEVSRDIKTYGLIFTGAECW